MKIYEYFFVNTTCIYILCIHFFFLISGAMKSTGTLYLACITFMVTTQLSVESAIDHEAPSSQDCKASEYQCLNRECIALDRYCDGLDDCSDKSDEPKFCSRKY